MNIILRYKRTLLIVSHSQDFMNGVCTNIIHLFQKKLEYYGVSLILDMLFDITSQLQKKRKRKKKSENCRE